MLITQLKAKETIDALVVGKAFILNCFGCKEVYFPEKCATELQKELSDAGKVTGILTMDYICNPENLKLHLEARKDEMKENEDKLLKILSPEQKSKYEAFKAEGRERMKDRKDRRAPMRGNRTEAPTTQNN